MITITSDFGSPYPAAMKGVLAGMTDARLVDIAHNLPRHDVRTAAFWLREILPYFPPAVHLVVVDPGVGTERDAIVVRANDHALVGPDNGVLVPAARRLAGARTGPSADESTSESNAATASEPSAEGTFESFVIDEADPESSTFHGRDVFAPAAGAVHEIGVGRLEELDRLRPVEEVTDFRLPDPVVEGGTARGEVLVVDDFGNVITNVPGLFVEDAEAVALDDEIIPVVETFAGVGSGERLATVGSHGNVELDVNRGRGDEAFGLEAGDDVHLEVTTRKR